MSRKTQIAEFVRTAKSASGYQAQPFKISVYGSATGYDGATADWDGSFIETARRASGLGGPALTGSTAALAWFTRKNRLYPRPRVGDVAFFAYSTDGDFGQPHVGIVTDVKKRGLFRVLEGQAVHRDLPDTVLERDHHVSEAIGFGRLPAGSENVTPSKKSPATSHIRMSDVGKPKTNSTITVQEALGLAVGLTDATRGVWDTVTATAMWQYQRERGILHLHGRPDERSLRMLGSETGWFEVDG